MPVPSQPSSRARPAAASSSGLRQRVLGAGEHEAVPGADRVAGERHPLEQELRAALHQVLVDVRARVALVAVGDDELLVALGGARERPLWPAGKPAPPRPRTSASSTSSSSSSGVSSSSARRRPDQSPGSVSTGSSSTDRHSRLRRLRALAGEDALDDAGAGVDHVAVADRRRGMAEAQADGLGERDRTVVAALAELEPEPLADPVDVLVAGGREARGPGAHADVARAARLEQVVVEGRDAVDGASRAGRSARRPRGGRRR